MKSAEQWLLELDANETDVAVCTCAEIEQIQLDAFKAGMTESAKVARAIGPCSGTKDWNESRWATTRQIGDAIDSARDAKQTL